MVAYTLSGAVHYTSISTACYKVFFLSQEAMAAKLDVLGAFRTVPVHPDNRWLLGMHWVGYIYMKKFLLFCSHFAPTMYDAIADGLLWVLHRTR